MGLLLGCAPKAVDPRTLQYREMRADVPWNTSPAYSWDDEHPGVVPTPMFANDRYGNCVIALRAHHTLRMEREETGATLAITDNDVVSQYLVEGNGQDNGLVMLWSLRDWRTKGWKAAGKRLYIHSFLEIQPQRHELVKEAMLVGTGLEFGVRLPLSAADQMDAHQTWDVVSGDRGVKDSWGGHAILAVAYDAEGVEFITWGKRQKATWRWVDAYADECYLVIDAPDTLGGSTIDAKILDLALADLS